MTNNTIVLRGAHVIDPSNNVDKITDVVIKDNLISAWDEITPDAEIIDLTGKYISPGWVDMHVHIYGPLGFADPDSIGVYQGVSTFVEAGGPGIETIDEYMTYFGGNQLETSLYTGIWLAPMGIVGVGHIEGDVRSISDVPILKWLDKVEKYRDQIRYLKFGAFSGYGTGPLKIGKGLSEIVGLPIYCHIGEFQQQPGRDSAYEIYRIAEAGDMVTHIYHGNEIGILDENGKVLPLVRQAAERGVIFDTGFGGFNFNWKVAEAGVEQDFLPHCISSDLQQYNVVGPVYSLANVMSIFLKLGLSVSDIIKRVTSAPADALKLDDRAGSLTPGMPADITVFYIEEGEFEFYDTDNNSRTGNERFVPTITFKNGKKINCDLELCQNEENWLLEVAEEAPSNTIDNLNSQQRKFLGKFAKALEHEHWNDIGIAGFDLDKALELTKIFHAVREDSGLKIKDATTAVLDSLLESKFRIPVGVLLVRAGRDLTLQRFREISSDTAEI